MHCPTIKSLSPGRACEPGSKPGVSLEGARAGDWESAWMGPDSIVKQRAQS